MAERRDSERNVRGSASPPASSILRGALSRWASLLGGEYLGKKGKKAWKCRFCGVIGSHRRGCHYVTQEHHRPPKRMRRGILGHRARAARRGHGERTTT